VHHPEVRYEAIFHYAIGVGYWACLVYATGPIVSLNCFNTEEDASLLGHIVIS